jgi:hypothetical protein
MRNKMNNITIILIQALTVVLRLFSVSTRRCVISYVDQGINYSGQYIASIFRKIYLKMYMMDSSEMWDQAIQSKRCQIPWERNHNVLLTHKWLNGSALTGYVSTIYWQGMWARSVLLTGYVRTIRLIDRVCEHDPSYFQGMCARSVLLTGYVSTIRLIDRVCEHDPSYFVAVSGNFLEIRKLCYTTQFQNATPLGFLQQENSLLTSYGLATLNRY